MVNFRNTTLPKMMAHYDVADFKGKNSKPQRNAKRATVRRIKKNEKNTAKREWMKEVN